MSAWTDALTKCATEKDVEGCAKQACEDAAVVACAAATGGSGAVLCAGIAPIVADAVFKYAWPAAEAVWNGAKSAVSDVAHSLGNFLGITHDPYENDIRLQKAQILWQIIAQGSSTINTAVSDGLSALSSISTEMSVPGVESSGSVSSVNSQAISSIRPVETQLVTDAIWSIKNVWNSSLMSQNDWTKAYDISDGAGHSIHMFSPKEIQTINDAWLTNFAKYHDKKYWPGTAYASGVITAGEFVSQNTTPWFPARFGVNLDSIAGTNPQDFAWVIALAQKGWTDRMSAISGAVIDGSAKLAVRKASFQAQESSDGSGLFAVLGLLAVGGLGYWAWRRYG